MAADKDKGPEIALNPQLLKLDTLEEAQIAWRTIKSYWNMALKTNDLGRAATYTLVLGDMERMIAIMGGILPPEHGQK